MPKQSLEPSQKRQLENWIDEVREHEHSALKWAALLFKIKESGYWQAVASSWPEFCEDTFGYKKSMAYRYVACGEALQEEPRRFESKPPKNLGDVDGKGKVRSSGLKKVRYVGTEIVSKDTMSAKADTEVPIHYAKPVAVPTTIAERLNDLVREGMRLPYSDPAFRHFLSGLLALQKHVQGEMTSILDQVPAVKPRSRCTIEEAKAFCKTIGLPEDDGEWFFWKMDGAGWKNSGVAVASWQGTIQAWKRSGYMCSQTAAARAQRNGGPEKPEQRASKELDREIAKLRRMQ